MPRGPDLWTVDDEVPGLAGATRRMTIVRLSDGALLFFNAIPLAEEALKELHALGRPSQLVVPNVFHCLDAPAFAERLSLRAFVPDVSLEVLRARMPCEPASAFACPDATLHVVEGFKTKELVLEAKGALIVADLVTNSRHGSGFNGFMMRLVGFTGDGPKLPRPVRLRVQRDRAAVQGLLRRLAERPGLSRLIPTHGDVIEADVAGVLRRVADAI